MPQVGAYDGIV